MIVLEHADTTVQVFPDGRVVADGAEMVLDVPTMQRLVLAVDPPRLAGIGPQVGIGEHTMKLTIGGVTLTIRHKGDFKTIPRSVAGPLAVLFGLAEVVLGQAPLDPWIAKLPLPIDTEGLVLRFHTHEPLLSEHSDLKWLSVFADGTCRTFEKAAADTRGRAGVVTMIAPEVVVTMTERVARLMLPRKANALYEHDEDHHVTFWVQRVDPATGSLVIGEYSWSFLMKAEAACRARIDRIFARGEFEIMYALYEMLAPLR